MHNTSNKSALRGKSLDQQTESLNGRQIQAPKANVTAADDDVQSMEECQDRSKDQIQEWIFSR